MPRIAAERKVTIKTVTGGADKFFPRLIGVSFEEDGVDAQGNKKMRLKDVLPVLPLAQIIGFANGGKPGATDKGEFVKFLGSFRGTNLSTGEQIDSPVCILPTFLGDGLWAALQTPDRRGPVQIAFEVGVKYSETSVTKYEYVIHDVLPRDANTDPLAMLANAVSSGSPLLSAPTPTVAPTPAPTQAPAPAPTQAPASAKRK